MSWADKVKAAALAALAERTATAASTALDTRPTWNPHEVWLTRVHPPRDLAAQASKSDPSAPPGQRTAPLD